MLPFHTKIQGFPWIEKGENLRLLLAEEWVDPLGRHKRFLQAAIMDKEYTDWQNTYDPAIYERAGRPHQHLPRHNQPRPFHYRMWLGGAFWKVVGEKKREEPMFAIDRLPNDVVRVEYGEPSSTTPRRMHRKNCGACCIDGVYAGKRGRDMAIPSPFSFHRYISR